MTTLVNFIFSSQTPIGTLCFSKGYQVLKARRFTFEKTKFWTFSDKIVLILISCFMSKTAKCQLIKKILALRMHSSFLLETSISLVFVTS